MHVTPAARHAVSNSVRSAGSAAQRIIRLLPHFLQLGVRRAGVVRLPQRLGVERGPWGEAVGVEDHRLGVQFQPAFQLARSA
jgi:hypothetical protein